MYNEDKKLITEITRKNNMDENLAKFADAVMTADFEYACQKFALNYVVIRELMATKILQRIHIFNDVLWESISWSEHIWQEMRPNWMTRIWRLSPK